ncbi:MAG: glycosyltransferase WbuB [Anaerolineales bacterium]|nr:MAG: glycosyltransferase WbuB [Anaerolineales bacterium]
MKTTNQPRVLMLLENNPYPKDSRVRREATSLTAAGYEVTVISPKESGQPWYKVCDKVRVYRFPAPPEANGFLGYMWEYGYSMIATFFISLFVFLRHGFNIIHTHNPPDTFVLIVIWYKLLGKRFVYDHHDLAPEMYFARFGGSGNPLVHKALVWFEKLSLWLADHVIATNQSYKAMEMERGRVPENRITIVRNGPDLNRLRLVDDKPDVFQQGKTILCYVGSMGFHDGVDHLLRALYNLVYELERTDIFCVLVGAGDAWLGLKALAEQLHLTDYVLFTGWVEHTKVAGYLCAADICLAPEPSNAYNDRSTMIKITEYMALGRPIVAFDLPEHRVTAQGAAVYARPNDELDFAWQIVTLMDDPQQRQKMGRMGQTRVETELAWSHQEGHLLEVYQALGHARGKKRAKNVLRSWLKRARILPFVHRFKAWYYRLGGKRRLVKVPIDKLHCQERAFVALQAYLGQSIDHFPPCRFFEMSLTAPEKARDAFGQWLRECLIDKQAYKVPISEGGWANGSLVKEVLQVHQERGVALTDFEQADPALVDEAIARRVRYYFDVFNSIKEKG